MKKYLMQSTEKEKEISDKDKDKIIIKRNLL